MSRRRVHLRNVFALRGRSHYGLGWLAGGSAAQRGEAITLLVIPTSVTLRHLAECRASMTCVALVMSGPGPERIVPNPRVMLLTLESRFPAWICSLVNTRKRRGWTCRYRVNANLTAFVEIYHNTYNTSLWYSTKLSLLLPNGWAGNKWIIQLPAVAWPSLTKWAQHLVAQVADVPGACIRISAHSGWVTQWLKWLKTPIISA